MSIRFPTQDELNQMFMEQLAEDQRKLEAYLASVGQTLPSSIPPQVPRGEGAVENAMIENSGPPLIAGVVDVFKTPPQPPVPVPPGRKDKKPTAACQYCGKLFTATKMGMAIMQRNRHTKKDHPQESLG